MVEVAERVTVTMARLTITGGNATVRVGGGIYNYGELVLNNSRVSGTRPTTAPADRLGAVTGL